MNFSPFVYALDQQNIASPGAARWMDNRAATTGGLVGSKADGTSAGDQRKARAALMDMAEGVPAASGSSARTAPAHVLTAVSMHNVRSGHHHHQLAMYEVHRSYAKM
jgi:hypothetical protein